MNRRRGTTYVGKLVSEYFLSCYQTSKVIHIPSIHPEFLTVPRSPDIGAPLQVIQPRTLYRRKGLAQFGRFCSSTNINPCFQTLSISGHMRYRETIQRTLHKNNKLILLNNRGQNASSLLETKRYLSRWRHERGRGNVDRNSFHARLPYEVNREPRPEFGIPKYYHYDIFEGESIIREIEHCQPIVKRSRKHVPYTDASSEKMDWGLQSRCIVLR